MEIEQEFCLTNSWTCSIWIGGNKTKAAEGWDGGLNWSQGVGVETVSSTRLVKCKGATSAEQKLDSALMCCFPSTGTLPPIRQRRRLLVTCYLTGTGLHAWEVLNQTINLWHSSLTVTLPSPILVFLGRYPYPSLPVPHLSSFTSSLPFLLLSVPPCSCLLVVHANSHPSLPHPSPPQPTSHPFPCGDFSSVKCLSGPATHPSHPLTTPLAEWMWDKREWERWNHSSSHTRHPCGCGSSGMFHREDCRSRESTLFVI